MDFSNIFLTSCAWMFSGKGDTNDGYSRLANLAIGVVMILGGVSQFIHSSNLFRDIIVGVYVIIFGLAVAGLELLPQVPPYVPRYASFLFSFIGRGVFYVFVGSIVLQGGWSRILAGTIIIIVGLGYCALEFAPQIEPPSNMRDADAGWGAEQV